MTLDFQGSTMSPVRNRNLGSGMATICRSVGIGVRDPDQALEVAGIVHISGEQAETPAAPVNTDGGLLYTKADGKPYWRSYDVAEFALNTDTDTTYTAGNGLTLTSTTFTVCDPATLAQLNESTDATDDKILLWDESGSVWKYMTLDDLQDSIDTGGGGGEANEDSFKTISVSGQSDVVADADDDTLTLAEAGGVTITTNAGTDTITISSADTNTQLTTEQVQDIVGGMLTGNTETRISVTYEDGDGTIDFAVDDMTADTNTTYSAGNGIALSTTTFSVAGGAGLAQESSGLALDDPINLSQLTESTDATDDKILLWDESASAWKYMTLDDLQDSIDTDTNTDTTYSAGNGIALSTTTFSVAGGAGLVQEGSGLALDDPANLSQLTESTDATDDKILLWDESASAWKHMTLDDLQDAIDTDTDTDTTYSAGNGIALSGTTFSVAGGAGLVQESSGVALDDPANLSQLTESTDATDDKIFLWDESASAWKYMTLDDLQDSIDTDTDTNTTYSAGNGIALSTTTFSVAGGAGLAQESSGLALSHLGIEALSDPDADRIMFWDDDAGAMKFLVPNDNLAISGTNLNATDTNTTYSAGNGIALSGTTFSVAGGSGLTQESSGLALDDPINLSQLTESTDATDDKVFLWDESASAWKYMTLDDLQDSIDTGSGDANEYSFKTISVSGQSDVVADQDDDTLTLVAGTNVTITTTADQITFASADTNTQLTTEAVQDIVGGMIAGNTETRIAVSYEDGDGTLDFVVDDMSGGISHDGSTANGVLTYKDADEATVEANMTFNGNSLAVTTGSASAIPCTIKAAGSQTADLLLIENSSSASLVAVEKDGTIELGGSGTGQIKRENVSGTDVAGKILDLRGGKSTGDEPGGEIRFSTSPPGSSGSGVNNQAQALVIDGNKVVEFKIAEVADGGDEYAYDNKVLKIKVNGTEYFLPLHVESLGGGGGMP